jgi:deoxyribodipyrimidine photo-lyase
VFYGTPAEVFSLLFSQYAVQTVWFNTDYEPYARERESVIEKLTVAHGVAFRGVKDQVVFDPDEVVKDDGSPYTVFTPYSKKWLNRLKVTEMHHFPSADLLHNLVSIKSEPLISLPEMGFEPVDTLVSTLLVDSAKISDYHLMRDNLSVDGTSRLSVHLRFGTLSIRRLVAMVKSLNDVYLNELIWREFYMMILWHFPYVVDSAFKPRFNGIEWSNNEVHFDAWCRGETGYLLVDAAMKQINTTGFMHNRARMVAASFLTRHLLIDWRWGEAYFARRLTDYELSSNNGGWQWAAGTGCDAVPYFRIFNPQLQAKRFDPQGVYQKKWLETKDFFRKPIVEHTFARERALRIYKSCLER